MTTRVLVVEDSATQAEALRAALESAGYEVMLAMRGEDALERLEADECDIVVSDILMPGAVDGYELCRRIKSGPRREIPVVLFTSLADPLDIIRGLECGADNFFTKSHGTEHLVQRIKLLLDTRHARAQGRVRLGVKVYFLGREFTVTSEREQIIDLLMSTFEDAVLQNRALVRREAELARSHNSLNGLYRIAVGLNQAASEAEVLETALDRALELPGVQAGWISLRDGPSGFRLAAARNLPPALAAPGAMEGDCLCRRRLLSGELDAVANVLECERLQQARGDTRGLRFHATVPLWVGDRTIGVMNLVGAEQGLFGEEDLRTLYGIGNQIAVALERAQLHEHMEQLVGERTAALTAEIAERRRAEEALRLSDSILRRIGNLVLVADADGDIVYVSPSVEAVLGYAPLELMGEGWWLTAFDDPAEREREREAAARAARGEVPARRQPYERPVKARDGRARWILWSDSKGPGDLLIGVGYDVTERRHLEEQLRLAQRMEAVGQLAGGVAHDFNNLLAAMKGVIDLALLDQPPESALAGEFRELDQLVRRAADLTRQLLTFGRRQALEVRVVDVNALLGDVVKLLGRLIGEDVRLTVRLTADRPTVQADPGQLEQVVMNLCVNARDAMPRGGELTLLTESVTVDEEFCVTHPWARPGEYVRLTVSDTGMGMDAETRARIFEPFFTTKELGRGTGLGLAVVYGIVKQHEGLIHVYSEPGHGTTFRVYLPLHGGPAEPAPQGAAEELPRGTELVLLTEDDDALRSTGQRLLERLGYHVLVAHNGREALDVLERGGRPPDLVILDAVMPVMGGVAAFQQMRRRFPSVRVLFTTGYSRETPHLEQVEVPMLRKPYGVRELAQAVRRALERPAGGW
jgi:PAS domain S-box-containing protein